MLWDPCTTRTISAKTQQQKNDFNVFEGMTVKGNAALTMSRGRVVWSDDCLHTEAGWGRFVPRKPFADFAQSLALRHGLNAPTRVNRKGVSE